MNWYVGYVVLISVVVSVPLAGAQTCPVARPSIETALLHRTCGTQGIPVALVRAVIRVESGGHPYALRINAGRVNRRQCIDVAGVRTGRLVHRGDRRRARGGGLDREAAGMAVDVEHA